MAFSYLFYIELSVLALKKGEPIPGQNIIEIIFLQILDALGEDQSPGIRSSSLALLNVRKKLFYETFRVEFLSKVNNAPQSRHLGGVKDLNKIKTISDMQGVHILMMLYEILTKTLQVKAPVTSPNDLNKSACIDRSVVDALFALHAAHSPKIRERILLCQQ